MATHLNHINAGLPFFITFTCIEWKPLIAEANGYQGFYNWFNYLTKQEVKILSYVIMPNHFHGVLHFSNDSKGSINSYLANGKRFLAYDLIKRLGLLENQNLLNELSALLTAGDLSRGSKHKVFKTSFDAKPCSDRSMLLRVMKYIHHNPVKGKWDLAKSHADYPHSSASFYEKGLENQYVTDYREVYGI
ncbi:MAG: REP element-mobilizing transposase RayT [Sphingobacteriales bacterium]|jgi:REP element-mobilizing transposase RayT